MLKEVTRSDLRLEHVSVFETACPRILYDYKDEVIRTALCGKDEALVCQFGLPFLFELVVGTIMYFYVRTVDSEWDDYAIER